MNTLYVPLEHVFDLMVPNVKIFNGEFPVMKEFGQVVSYQNSFLEQGYEARIIVSKSFSVYEENSSNRELFHDEQILINFKDNLENFYVEALDFANVKGGDLGTGLTFGDAIVMAQRGYAIQRKGWNGKGMFVAYMPSLHLPPFNTQDTTRKVNDRTAKWIGEDAELNCNPYFAMYTADKKWQPGWLASQTDMLAHDWQIKSN